MLQTCVLSIKQILVLSTSRKKESVTKVESNHIQRNDDLHLK